MFEEPQVIDADEYVAQVVAQREAELEGKREKKLKYMRDWYSANTETAKQKAKQWRDTNREKVKKSKKADYALNSERYKQKARLWVKNNPEKRYDTWLKRKYGITLAEYNELLQKQGHACKICKSTAPGGRSNKWNTDHCHTTGDVRGLLCSKCNIGLGYFDDDPTKLQAAIAYLQRAL